MKGLYFWNVGEHLKKQVQTLAAIDPNDLEGNILALKYSVIIDDNELVKHFENRRFSKRFSKEETKKALQNLQVRGLIDKKGLITEAGIETLKTLVQFRKRRK